MIQTSNFKTAFAHPDAVAIARIVPRNFKGRRYPLLAPSWSLLRRSRSGELTDAQWRAEYQATVLDQVDPLEVLAAVGPDAVLLCYESRAEALAGGCHRRQVALWLSAALGGIDVHEL
jgi:hypothetical protein